MRRLIGIWTRDLIQEFKHRAAQGEAESVEEVGRCDSSARRFLARHCRASRSRCKTFLFERMYRHHKVNRMMSQARRIVRELFGLFIAEPDTLPSPWRERAQAGGQATWRSARGSSATTSPA